MGKVKCAECGEEIGDEDIFRHQKKPYCSECTAQHLNEKHGRRIGEPAGTRPTEDTKTKHGPEGRRAHTYTSY